MVETALVLGSTLSDPLPPLPYQPFTFAISLTVHMWLLVGVSCPSMFPLCVVQSTTASRAAKVVADPIRRCCSSTCPVGLSTTSSSAPEVWVHLKRNIPHPARRPQQLEGHRKNGVKRHGVPPTARIIRHVPPENAYIVCPRAHFMLVDSVAIGPLLFTMTRAVSSLLPVPHSSCTLEGCEDSQPKQATD